MTNKQPYYITLDQLKIITDAVGDGKDFPKFTNDPWCNYLIDCLLADDELPIWDLKSYQNEIEAAKE